MRLTGNTTLITGATSGIGRALAEEFHRRGNQVVIAGRRQHLLDEIAAAHPGMRGLWLDVEDPDVVDAFAACVARTVPDLNVLVNNAGISRPEDLLADRVDLETPRSVVETNVLSVLRLTMALLPVLRRQASATVMATSSGLAFVPRANYPTYCASKAFLHSWLQSLRAQLRGTSVEVLELVPPYVQTELGGLEQASNPHAMPLAEYVAEVMEILGRGSPPGGEVLVEQVRPLRFAEGVMAYGQAFERLNEPG